MIRAARRWVREDAAFVAVAPCLVGATYTPLGGALAAPLRALTYSGARALLDALHLPYTAHVERFTLARGAASITVTGACSGLLPLAIWCAVMFVTPLPWRRKAPHLLAGALLLQAMNVARTAHLFQLVALGSPRFDLYHEWLWPGAKLGVIFGYPLLLLLAQRWAGAADRAGGPGDGAERREGVAL